MRAIIAAVLGSILAGCAPTKTPPVGDQTAEGTAPGQSAAAAISYTDELDSLVESLEAKAQALPGGTTAAHRDAMHSFFAAVVDVLPALEGPDQSGAFLQQLRAIETARDRLSPDVKTASIEPAINSGLRAMSAALHRIGRDEDVSGQTLSGLLGRLSAKVDEWEQVRAVGRPYIAADAGRLAARVARQMADRLAGRVTDAPALATPEPPPAAVDAPAAAKTEAPAPHAPAPAEAETPAPDAPAPAEAETPAPDAPAPAEAETPAPDPPAGEEKPAEEAPAEPAPAQELNK